MWRCVMTCNIINAVQRYSLYVVLVARFLQVCIHVYVFFCWVCMHIAFVVNANTFGFLFCGLACMFLWWFSLYLACIFAHVCAHFCRYMHIRIVKNRSTIEVTERKVEATDVAQFSAYSSRSANVRQCSACKAMSYDAMECMISMDINYTWYLCIVYVCMACCLRYALVYLSAHKHAAHSAYRSMYTYIYIYIHIYTVIYIYTVYA